MSTCTHPRMAKVEYSINTWICDNDDHPECHFTVTSQGPEPIELSESGVGAICRERNRQIEKGYTAEHDNEHLPSQLVAAAMAYLYIARGDNNKAAYHWPWQPRLLKIGPARASLVRAGALIAAAIDRHDRALAENKK